MMTDMNRTAMELVRVARNLVGNRWLDLEEGKKYRVIKNGTSLDWEVSITGGWTIKSIKLPVGAVIVYTGQRMGWGSDNIRKPNFSWNGHKGAFEPNSWGRIDVEWIEEE